MNLFKRKTKIQDQITKTQLDTNVTPVTESNLVPSDDSKSEKNVLQLNLDEISESSKLLSRSITEVHNSVENLTSATSSQAEELSNASSLLESFKDNMENLAYNITNVQIKIFETDNSSEEGLSTLTALDDSLKSLQGSFNLVSDIVNALVAKLESVNSITDSINQIATQTNLLSLNAAIEAARAGEAGKGFSVVAGEVRKLAENSKVSVQSITKILDEIKTDILSASKAMSDGNSALNKQFNTLLDTKEKFSIIKTNSNESKDEIDQCIVNLTTASEEKDKVITTIETLTGLSQENAALCQEINASMELQNMNIEKLDEKIESLVKEIVTI